MFLCLWVGFSFSLESQKGLDGDCWSLSISLLTFFVDLPDTKPLTKAKSVVKPFQSWNHENIGDLYTNTIVIKFVVKWVHVDVNDIEIASLTKFNKLTLKELEDVFFCDAKV